MFTLKNTSYHDIYASGELGNQEQRSTEPWRTHSYEHNQLIPRALMRRGADWSAIWRGVFRLRSHLGSL